jgi:hypothetical protein
MSLISYVMAQIEQGQEEPIICQFGRIDARVGESPTVVIRRAQI